MPAPNVFARPRSAGRLADRALAGLVLAGLLHTLWFFRAHGHLPQPFIYDLADPLMDLYWTAWWGHQPGPYTVWNSIYPPLSFVFTRVLSNPACYAGDAFSARDCDFTLRWFATFGFSILNTVLAWRVFRRQGHGCPLSRAFVVGLGFPALFAADRGNLIVPCFTCFILAFGGLLRKLPQRAFALALAINFKPYLLILLIVPVILRRWVWLAWLTGSGLAIYGLTFALMNTGSPLELLANLTVFGSEVVENHWERVYASTSLTPLIRFANSDFPWLLYFDSNTLDTLVYIATALIRTGLVGSLLVFVLYAWRDPQLPVRRLVAMALALLFVVSELGGGYAMMFVVFMTLLEPWHGLVRCTMLLCAYLLCIPSDYILLPNLHLSTGSWWSDRTVSATFGVAVGQFLRPLLMLLILYCYVLLNLADHRRPIPGERKPPASE